MEMDKNTVSAQGQLPLDAHISFEGMGRRGIKIAFVGNSITRHGRRRRLDGIAIGRRPQRKKIMCM